MSVDRRIKRLLVTSDEDLGRVNLDPFAIGLADSLHRSGQYEAYYYGQPVDTDITSTITLPKQNMTACPQEGNAGRQRVQRFLQLAAHLLRDLPAEQNKLLIILSGTLRWVGQLVQALVKVGLRRRTVVVLHLRVEAVPLHSKTANLFYFADLVIVESSFAARAIAHCCRDQSPPIRCPVRQIRPGIHKSIFEKTPSPIPFPEGGVGDPGAGSQPDLRNQQHKDIRNDERQVILDRQYGALVDQQRRELFGTSSNGFLVACGPWYFPDHQMLFAMHVFQILVHGFYWRCDECSRLNVDRYNAETLGFAPGECCSRCRKRRPTQTVGWPRARLYVPLVPDTAVESTDVVPVLSSLRRRMQLDDQIVFDGDGRIPRVKSRCELFQRLAAMDAYYLPHIGAELRRSLLVVSAAGTPTITTDFGAVNELFSERVLLVPPQSHVLNSDGYFNAHIDVAGSVSALIDLARSKSERRRLSATSRAANDFLDWSVIGQQWRSELNQLAVGEPPSENRVRRPRDSESGMESSF